MSSLTESKEWKQLTKDYSDIGSSINIKQLFSSDAQRFKNFRYY